MSLEVRVRLAGIEVAKWLALFGNDVSREGVVLVNRDNPIYRHLGDELGLPTMAEDAAVELLVTEEALRPEVTEAEARSRRMFNASIDKVLESPAAVAVLALSAVDSALGGLPSRVDALSVEVHRRG